MQAAVVQKAETLSSANLPLDGSDKRNGGNCRTIGCHGFSLIKIPRTGGICLNGINEKNQTFAGQAEKRLVCMMDNLVHLYHEQKIYQKNKYLSIFFLTSFF